MRKEHALKVVELLMAIPVEMEPTIHCLHVYSDAIIVYVRVMYPNGKSNVFRYVLKYPASNPEGALHCDWEVSSKFTFTGDDSTITGELKSYKWRSSAWIDSPDDNVKKESPWDQSKMTEI